MADKIEMEIYKPRYHRNPERCSENCNLDCDLECEICGADPATAKKYIIFKSEMPTTMDKAMLGNIGGSIQICPSCLKEIIRIAKDEVF